MNYKQLNNLTGWLAFGIALVVYLMTMAPTASFWDCGEFIACANELEVPHPPGAPFFLLLGRLFAMFSFGEPYEVGNIAWMLNFMSALSSAFTVLFTTWITTHLARKLVNKVNGPEVAPNGGQTIAIMASGLVAGLANTFADSFWFNAVEAEVYALSSFFTAIVVWLMFKWEARADEPRNERWIILITYLMGLSIGVHLLNLLAIPALAFIYYFRKYEFSIQGFIVTGLVSVAFLGIVQTGIILYSFDLAWGLEQLLVGVQSAAGVDQGGLGLPLGSGIILFFILLFGAMIAGIWYSHKIKNVPLNMVLMSLLVIYMGFSSYLMIPIRSQANPPIDENNPENTKTFISYMKREQYGDRPLLKGPLYNARPSGLEEDGEEYVLEPGADKYTFLGMKRKYKYRDRDEIYFPRMYDRNKYKKEIPFGYTNYVARIGNPNTPDDDRPTGGENLEFFFDYQVSHMYGRYFRWNFVGKEGDVQHDSYESGINRGRIGKLPDHLANHPARNHFFYLPLLLGLIGLAWQAYKRGADATVIGLLFFFTGYAIILYLNQYPQQPRERDYSFAGSFQTFAIWIGLSVIAIFQMLEQRMGNVGAYLGAALGIFTTGLMGYAGWDDHSRAGRYLAPDSAYNLLNSCAKNAVLFTNGDNDTFPLWYIQEVEGVRPDVRVLCLSYVNTDWYIDQMKQQMNASPAMPITLQNYVGQNNQSKSLRTDNLDLKLPANTDELIRQGIIAQDDVPFIESPMTWRVPGRGGQGAKYLELKDLLIINLLENVAKGDPANNVAPWERPVYFANTVSPSNIIGLQKYLRQEGLAYRVLPVVKPSKSDPMVANMGYTETDSMYKHLMTTFRYRNLDDPSVYYDENCFRMISNYHRTFYRLIVSLLNDADDLAARNVSLTAAMDTVPDPASLQAEINANLVRIDSLKAQAQRALDFKAENLPIELVTPDESVDPLGIMSTAVLFRRMGNVEKAEELFALGLERSTGRLNYHDETGTRFFNRNFYLYPLQIASQDYRQAGNAAKADSIQQLLIQLQAGQPRR